MLFLQTVMPLMSVWQFLILLIGFVSPKIIAYFENPLWPAWKKVLVNIAFHVFVTFAYLGAAGNFTRVTFENSENFLVVLGQLVIYSTLSYAGLWKAERINEKASLAKKSALRKLGLGPKVNPLSPNNKPLGSDDNR